MDSPSSKHNLSFPPCMYRNMDIDLEQVNSPDMDADLSPNKVETPNLHTDGEEITLVSIMKVIEVSSLPYSYT
ncbi:hypothetical protein A2U01_0023836 [Trifolium medium]|uniref:Uncharacterized protein n=1 Tax=Trifolium medium TaxID=97028 RepID=A0A392NTP5_9FABA|nr:hypothetical protein [Trifolium medium]